MVVNIHIGAEKSIPGILSVNALIYRAISPDLAAESFLVAFGLLSPARNLVRDHEEEAEHHMSSPVLVRPLPEHLTNAVVVLNFLQEIVFIGTPSHVQDSLLTPHPVTTLPLPPEHSDSCLLKPLENRGVQPTSNSPHEVAGQGSSLPVDSA